MKKITIILVLTFVILAACVPSLSSSAVLVENEEVILPLPTATAAPSPTPDPFTNEALAQRTYGEGELTVEYLWERQEDFIFG